jgi:hypothetical protein
MSRAIAAISSSALIPLTGLGRLVAAVWAEMSRDVAHPYRPERHYMRGPGPAWHAKHDPKP